MMPFRILFLSLLCLPLAAPLVSAPAAEGQTVLTAAEQEKVASAGIDADLRINLYTKFVSEHADRIRRLAGRSEPGVPRAMDHELENFASLVDELSDNLDQYGGRMADMRGALKKLDKSIPEWQKLIAGVPENAAYQTSRDDASGSLSDLASQTKKLTHKEDVYFKEHKKAKGQQWAEPQ